MFRALVVAAQAEAAAAQRRQQAEQQQAEAAESLEGLQAATAEAAASAAALQQLVQQLGRGQQEAELLRSQQQAARQQLRLQQQQLDALADLGRQLETVAQDLSQLSGSSSSAGAFTDIAAAGSQASSSAEDLEAAAAAARSMLAAAADLQQRWQLHQQQSNLPARDAALVQQQLVAAEVAITEVERRHAELEGEVGVWKQVGVLLCMLRRDAATGQVVCLAAVWLCLMGWCLRRQQACLPPADLISKA